MSANVRMCAATKEVWYPGVLQVLQGTIKFNSTGGLVTLGTLPEGATLVKVEVDVKTAFNAATTNVLTVGTVADDDAYVTADDVNEGAAGFTSVGGNGTAITADTVVKAKYVQTGDAATAGEADVYVYFK